MKKIPYGISNFETIIREGYYFVDKTMYIPKIEDKASYLFFMRPRRFGKSLFADMLEAYYDIEAKDKFDELFGNLWIGSRPTEEANRYQVLRFDFSQTVAPLNRLYDTFNSYCCGIIDRFISKYKKYYDQLAIDKVAATCDAGAKLNIIDSYAKWKTIPIYLIIDEYDNFTNVVLANEGKEEFHKLTHAEGFYRDFFKILKPMFRRIFLTGVSPVTMDDLTSGFNIAIDISHMSKFNSMLGFSEQELRDMLSYYKSRGAFAREVDDVLDEMRPWYNNYCFSNKCCGRESVYNSSMTMYYLGNLIDSDADSEEMLDRNTRTDHNKLRQLVQIDKQRKPGYRDSVIMEIANKGYLDMKLVESFPVMDIVDENNFRSLIYYYGMLTIQSVRGTLQRMVIPNQSVRLQYWDFILKEYAKVDTIDMGRLLNCFYTLAFDGDWKPLMRYLGDEYSRTSSVRDAIGGEHNVQGFVKAYLSMCDYHTFCPEIEMGYGYSDFLMIPQRSRFPEAVHSYIIETKYAKPSAPESEVERLSAEADAQLRRYLADTKLIPLLKGTTVHPVKLVFHGPNLVVCEEKSPGPEPTGQGSLWV